MPSPRPRRRLPLVAPDVLPPLYSRFADALFGVAVPPEAHATCERCAMCAEPASPRAPGRGPRASARAVTTTTTAGAVAASAFDPTTKCCTYHPALANFLVGAVLLDDDRSPAARAGRARVRDAIAAGSTASPLGLAQPAAYRTLYQASTGTDAFGAAHALRCPYYVTEGGLCGVWRHREATCATYFCKHVRGAAGHAFWQSLKGFLGALERALARHCVLDLDVGDAALAALFPPRDGHGAPPPLGRDALDERVDPARQRALWGAWFGREVEFYRECARRVDALSWGDVLAAGGAELATHVRLARAAFAATQGEAVPARVRLAAHQTVVLDDARARVVTYSAYDPIELPRALYDALGCFDGRPTRDARARIARRHGLELDDALVRRLVDFGLLRTVEVDAGAGAPRDQLG